MGFKGAISLRDYLTPGAILHGLCTYNIAAVQLLRAYGNSDPSNFRSFEARFSSPVIPGGILIYSSSLGADHRRARDFDVGNWTD